ncbi:MAG: MFS transporter, partial [Bifidobacteriaceae bacterium]|nr:MFS transporter [Bifidobacteriaceae bacterium]
TRFRSGKFLPWLRVSTFLIPAATILLFAMPTGASLQVKTIWAAVAYMLWDTSYTVCDVPIFALATSMTDNQKERDWLYLLNRLFMFVGGILVAAVVPLAYPAIGWTATAVIVSLTAIVTMAPVGFRAKERFFARGEQSPKVAELVRYLFKNRPLLVFNAAIIIASLTNTSAAVVNYVAIYCLGGTQWISVLALVMTAPMLVSIILAKQLIKRFDKMAVCLACMGVNLFLGVAMFFAGYHNTALFLSIIAARALLASTSGVLVAMFTADCVEYGHFTSGERSQGVAFSIQTFTAKLAGALSSAIAMFALGAAGFVSGEGAPQTADTIAWIWRLYTVIPVIAGVAAFVVLAWGYKLRDRDVVLMMRANAGEITRAEAEAGLSAKSA